MSAPTHREREAKFRVAPAENPLLFVQPIALEGYTFHASATHQQEDTYFDTRAYDLLRRGLALRVRQKGDGHEVGIKSIQATRQGAIQDRLDIAFALPTNAKPLDAATWPDAVSEYLAPYGVKTRKLHPLLVVRQQRQKSLLQPANSSTPLAEWSLDQVWIDSLTHDESATVSAIHSNGRASAHFYELELEQLPASDTAPARNPASTSSGDETFGALVKQVREGHKLTPVFASKLLRGLTLSVAQAHNNTDALTPTMSQAAAGRLLLHQQMLQIMLNEHGVRTSTRERYVHDMRVAIRRGRAALQLCQSAFAPEAVKPIERGLARLGRALGVLRDLDVALGNLRAFRRNQPQALHKGFKLLRATLKSRRAEAHTDLMVLLDSKKHRKFIVETLHFCTTPDPKTENDGDAVTPRQVRHTMPSTILAAFEAVRAYETVFEAETLPPLETFHALRIQAKFLRYLLEFTQHLLGDSGTELVTQLRDLQEHLGELNDAHVEQARLQQWAEDVEEELAGDAKIDAPIREAIAARQAEITSRMTALTNATPPHLAAFIAHPMRVKLATALATL